MISLLLTILFNNAYRRTSSSLFLLLLNSVLTILLALGLKPIGDDKLT
jgi:hypothetical protein